MFSWRRLWYFVIPLLYKSKRLFNSRVLLLSVLLNNLLPLSKILLDSPTPLNKRITFIIIGLILSQSDELLSFLDRFVLSVQNFLLRECKSILSQFMILNHIKMLYIFLLKSFFESLLMLLPDNSRLTDNLLEQGLLIGNLSSTHFPIILLIITTIYFTMIWSLEIHS